MLLNPEAVKFSRIGSCSPVIAMRTLSRPSQLPMDRVGLASTLNYADLFPLVTIKEPDIKPDIALTAR